MDCDGLLDWLDVEHTPIQTPLHVDSPLPNHTMRARAPTVQVRALKTALFVQTVLCA